jgi:hypothetical protein
MTPGVEWGHNRVNCFYMCLQWKKYFENLLKNHWAKRAEIYMIAL